MNFPDGKNPNRNKEAQNLDHNPWVKDESQEKKDPLPFTQEAFKKQGKHDAVFTIYKIKKINNWTEEEDKKLREVVGNLAVKKWKKVAEFFPEKNPIQCSSRYRRIKPGILKGYWTKGEDSKLMQYWQKCGKNWKLISKEMPQRSGKQIRDRFLNCLNPDLNKKKFNAKEDKLLISLYNQYGPAWSKISKHFKGRSGDMIKNRFFSFIRKKIIPNSTKLKFKKRVFINKKINETNIKKNLKAKKISDLSFGSACHNINNADEINLIYNINANNINSENIDNYKLLSVNFKQNEENQNFENFQKREKNRNVLKIENSNFAISKKEIENTKLENLEKKVIMDSIDLKASDATTAIDNRKAKFNTCIDNSNSKGFDEFNFEHFFRKKINKNRRINLQFDNSEKYNVYKKTNNLAETYEDNLIKNSFESNKNKKNYCNVNNNKITKNEEDYFEKINYKKKNLKSKKNILLNLKTERNFFINEQTRNINTKNSFDSDEKFKLKDINNNNNFKNANFNLDYEDNENYNEKELNEDCLLQCFKENKKQLVDLRPGIQKGKSDENVCYIGKEYLNTKNCQQNFSPIIQKSDKIKNFDCDEIFKNEDYKSSEFSAYSQHIEKMSTNLNAKKYLELQNNHNSDSKKKAFSTDKKVKLRKPLLKFILNKNNFTFAEKRLIKNKNKITNEIKNYKLKDNEAVAYGKNNINHDYKKNNENFHNKWQKTADYPQSITNNYNNNKIKLKKTTSKKFLKINKNIFTNAIKAKTVDLEPLKADQIKEPLFVSCRRKNVFNNYFSNFYYNLFQKENKCLLKDYSLKPEVTGPSFFLSCLFLTDLFKSNKNEIANEIDLFQLTLENQFNAFNCYLDKIYYDFLALNCINNFVFLPLKSSK